MVIVTKTPKLHPECHSEKAHGAVGNEWTKHSIYTHLLAVFATD